MNQDPNESKQVIPPESEPFGTVSNGSEDFGSVRNVAARFGTLRHVAERSAKHTLTVREVARMFEAAGVGRTERSVVNWCQPNRTGVARLDAYYDPNEGRYFITRESAELAIAEEQAKVARGGGPEGDAKSMSDTQAEAAGRVREAAPGPAARTQSANEENDRIAALEKEALDLKITNRAKDYFIDQLKEEREAFAEERGRYVEQLMSFNRRVGELETKLLGARTEDHQLPDHAESASDARSALS